MLINLSRKNSLILGLGIIILFFAAGITMLLRSNSSISKRAVDNENAGDKSTVQATPVAVNEQVNIEQPNLSVPITMNKFERHAVKDGRKLWEVTAERGRYIPQSNMAELEHSKLLLYRKDDSVIQLTSKLAKIHFTGTDLESADLNGQVELIYNEKVHINAENAEYNKTADIIKVPGEVKINTDRIDLSGKDLVAYVSKHEVHINQDVSTIIQPKNTQAKKG